MLLIKSNHILSKSRCRSLSSSFRTALWKREEGEEKRKREKEEEEEEEKRGRRRRRRRRGKPRVFWKAFFLSLSMNTKEQMMKPAFFPYEWLVFEP
jgi:hypothetical protein